MRLGKMSLFKKKTVGFVESKLSKLHALQNESSDAIDLVTRTIKRLELTNQETLETIGEIDNYCANLQDVRNSLNKNYTHNVAVITNFSKLIDVED
jgi:hypothetical protein